MNARVRVGTQGISSHLSWCTHGPVQRRPFLCFAEIGVLRVATPQLLAGIKCTELEHRKKIRVDNALRELPLETATEAAVWGVPFLSIKCQLLALIPEEHRDVSGLNI